MKKLIVILIALISIPTMLVMDDIRDDQKNKIIANGKVNVYDDWKSPPFYNKDVSPIFVLEENQIYQVKRIRYGKDYRAIKIKNTMGKSGWIFSGERFEFYREDNKSL